MIGIIISQIRVKQWIKNLLIFAPLFFSFKLFISEDLFSSIILFLTFSFSASFIYILNDIIDLEKDKLHPRKRNRPLPSGKLSKFNAIIIASILIALSISITYLYLNTNTLFIILAYVLLNLLYTLKLKHISIIDALCIAIGFELRIFAGCFAIGVLPSHFILMVTLFLALMLAFIKRKGELNSLNDESASHRKSLENYTVSLLDKFIFSSASISIFAYSLYTIDEHVIANVGNDYLKYSLIFVIYGIYRFIQLTEINIYNKEGDPTTLIYKDRPIQLCLLLWVLYIAFCFYVK